MAGPAESYPGCGDPVGEFHGQVLAVSFDEVFRRGCGEVDDQECVEPGAGFTELVQRVSDDGAVGERDGACQADGVAGREFPDGWSSLV